MLDLYVTVNINRSTKIQLSYCSLKELLLCYCYVIAKPTLGVVCPCIQEFKCVVYCSLGMIQQFAYLPGRIVVAF